MPEDHPKTILLVEDEVLIALGEEQLLRAEGYQVLLAHSGEDAVRLVCAQNKPVDLVLMDINLGRGMDGTQAAQRILAEREIPVIFLSSHTEKAVVEKTEQITSYGYVVKNSNPAVLFASIKMAFKLAQAHQRIRQSEKNLREAQREAHLGTWRTELATGVTTWSEELYLIIQRDTNLPSPTVQELGEIYTPESLVRRNTIVARAVESGEPFEVTLDLRRPDGEVRHVFLRGDVERAENGKIIALHGTAQDITEQVLAVEALNASDARYRRVVENAPDVIYTFSSKRGGIYYSPHAENLLGVSLDYLYEHPFLWNQSIHPDDLPRVAQVIEQFEAGRSYDVEYRLRDMQGNWHWVRDRSIGRYMQGEEVLIEGIASDITSRRVMEESLLASEERFRHMFERHTAAMLLLEPETGRILDANQAACAFYGYTRAELTAMQISDLNLLTPEEVAARRRETFGAQSRPFVVPHRLANGETRTVEVYSAPISFQGQTVLFSIIHDISERLVNDTILKMRLALLQQVGGETENEFLQASLDMITPLVDSPVGFFHLVQPDQQTLSLQAWSTRTLQEYCQAEGEGRHYPLDAAGVWADCFRQRRPVVYNDYTAAPGRKGLPAGHAEVRRVLSVPVTRGDKIVAILGVGNKPSDYTEHDIRLVSNLADVAWHVVTVKRSENALRAAEARLRLLSDNLADVGLYILAQDVHGALHFEFLSASMHSLTGVDIQTAMQDAGLIYAQVLPEYLPELARLEAQSKLDLAPFEIEVQQRHAVSGEVRWMLLRSTPSRRPDGSTVWYGAQIDITRRKTAEQRSQELLASKDLLLHEVQHRIKNNMSTIASLLHLQSESMNEPGARAELLQAETQVRSMTLLYDKLYASGEITDVSLRDYAPTLLRQVVDFFPHQANILVRTSIEDIILPPRLLTPLGLALNELTTNAMKYAFNGRDQGEIYVKAENLDGRVRLVFADDGVGLPPAEERVGSSGFGMRLVRLLVEQIGGEVTYENHPGARAIITFPLHEQ